VVPRVANQSSGTSYGVTRLSEALHNAGADIELHVLEPAPERGLDVSLCHYPARGFPGAWRLGWSPTMRRGIAAAVETADLVHNHSMWMMPNLYSHHAARRAGRPLVFSTHGTLSEWAMSRARLRKQLVWWAGQKAALEGAACLHATSESERDEMRKSGLKQAIAMLPNGVDIPENIATKEGTPPRLLFLSRIHPGKGVSWLLRAWKKLENRHPEWELVIAGPLSSSYADEMLAMAHDLGLQQIEFVGEVQGREKTDLIAGADVFVLPTHSENFGIVVAEALAHGTPVVVTKGAPWSGVAQHGCGWWIEKGAEALERTLDQAMCGSREELAAMGLRGRAWMEREFNWRLIGRQMLETYRWVLGRADQPAWVEPALT